MVRPAAPVEPTSLPPSDRIDTSHAPSAPETPHTIQPPVRMAATVLLPFSSGDLEVTPPRPIAQQRVGPLFSTVDVVTIAVMIREDGTVESVKAQTRPKTISESLLLANSLSVAKSWRFYPAMKDGRAVPYRAIVSLNTH